MKLKKRWEWNDKDGKGEMRMYEDLRLELGRFIAELEEKEAATRYFVPVEIIKNIKRAKALEKLLHEIYTQVSGYAGINLSSILRREFGIEEELMDHFKQWAPYSKEVFEDALHDAIDRAEIRAGNQGVFFEGTPTKKEAEEVLQLLKGIAHAAVKCQFQANLAGPELYVEILDKLLRFYAMPSTYPEGNFISFRNLISADRLYAMSGNDETITNALKAHARDWYQHSPFTFLESKEGYFSSEYVHQFIYALREDQLERLGIDYIRFIVDEFKQLKAKPDLSRSKNLMIILETVLSWKIN